MSAQVAEEISATDNHSRKTAQIFDTEMSYVDVGKGDPIVFLHGNPTSSYIWRNIIPHVSDIGRCLAPDLVGMGESGRSPTYSYRFVDHARYLDEWFEKANVGKKVVLVVQDWGSALGFFRAHRFPEQIAGICYMEAVVKERPWSDMSPEAQKIFKGIRETTTGEEFCLDRNLFVEKNIPERVIRKMAPEEMTRYRQPFRTPQDRLPTLVWVRQIPIAGAPKDMCDIANAYGEFLRTSSIPKLFIKADRGYILRNGGEALAFCRSWANQTEIEVPGIHYPQEDAPHEIGRALRKFVQSVHNS